MRRAWLVAGFVVATTALSVRAQAPTPDRPEFSGTWTLDTDASTELAKINLIPSATNTRQSGGGMRRGGFGGRGFGGSRSREQTSVATLTSDEQARLKAIAEVLKTGWMKLVVALHEPSFVINDARDRTSFFTTDGNAADNRVGAFTIPTTTRWEGERLLTEYAISSNFTLVYSYTLFANMKRLVVRIERKDAQNTRPLESNVYLLYRRSS